MRQPALLNSDCDGTAVEKFPLWHPRNALKYPLPAREGYLDFLRGFQSAGGEIGKLITVRPEWLRSWVTTRTIGRTGLSEFFDPRDVVYTNNDERDKARCAMNGFLRPIAFIDDKPHKVGLEIAHELSGRDIGAQRITLGVAPMLEAVKPLEFMRLTMSVMPSASSAPLRISRSGFRPYVLKKKGLPLPVPLAA